MPDYKEHFLPIDKMMRTDIMITMTVMVPMFNLNYMDCTSFMNMAMTAYWVKGAVGVSEAKVISYVGIISMPVNLIIISATLNVFLMLAPFTISFQPHHIQFFHHYPLHYLNKHNAPTGHYPTHCSTCLYSDTMIWTTFFKGTTHNCHPTFLILKWICCSAFQQV